MSIRDEWIILDNKADLTIPRLVSFIMAARAAHVMAERQRA